MCDDAETCAETSALACETVSSDECARWGVVAIPLVPYAATGHRLLGARRAEFTHYPRSVRYGVRSDRRPIGNRVSFNYDLMPAE